MSDKKTLAINFGSLSTVQIATYILPLIYLPYLVRVIGPDKFGAVAFAQAVVLYFNLITNLGTNLYAPREIAINKEDNFKLSSIVSNILFLKLIFLLLAILIYIAAIYIVPKFKAERILFTFTGGYLIVTALIPTWFFQGIEKMGNIAIANLLSRALGVFLIFTVIRNASDYIYVPLINVLAQVLGLFFMYYIMIKKEKIKIINPTISLTKKIIKESIPLFISNISISIYTGINTVILGFLTNYTIIAYYSAAEKIVRAGLLIMGQLGVVFYPYISKIFSISKEKAITTIKKTFVVTMLFAIPVTIFIFFNAGEITKLVFGSKFFASIITLQILSLLFVIIGLSNVFGMQILLPFGKRKELMKPIITAGIVNLALIFYLVPILKQNGAALAWVISEVWVTFWMYFETKKLEAFLIDKAILLKFVVLSFCLFSSMYINKFIGINLALNVIIYVFIYGFLLIGLRLVDIKNKTVLI